VPEVLTKFNIMGQQQLGFDFFSTPPEETKPEKKKVVKAPEVPAEEKVSKVEELSKVEEISTLEEVAEAGEVSKVEEVSEVEEVLDVAETSEVANVEKSDLVIEVDEEIREVDFIAAEQPLLTKTKATAVTARKSTRGRMKLSDMDVLVDLVDVPEDEILFQKNYYSIGDVSNMFKVNISLIRFWENEFDILKPKKNGKGDRLFRPQDIKNLQLIYHLLREKKYTIDGAKVFLKKNKKTEETFELIDALKKTKAFLLDLKANL
jgi:DNA-binding transcriptional MerR regulator